MFFKTLEESLLVLNLLLKVGVGVCGGVGGVIQKWEFFKGRIFLDFLFEMQVSQNM